MSRHCKFTRQPFVNPYLIASKGQASVVARSHQGAGINGLHIHDAAYLMYYWCLLGMQDSLPKFAATIATFKSIADGSQRGSSAVSLCGKLQVSSSFQVSLQLEPEDPIAGKQIAAVADARWSVAAVDS